VGGVLIISKFERSTLDFYNAKSRKAGRCEATAARIFSFFNTPVGGGGTQMVVVNNIILERQVLIKY